MRILTPGRLATGRRYSCVGRHCSARDGGGGVSADLHLHDLGHAGNHFAAASGASTRELMSRMGHASMRTALIYQHRTAERDRAIADALDVMLRGSERRFGHFLGKPAADE